MTDSRSSTTKDRYRTFLIVWSGQLVSLVGSNLTWFGISIWVFLETRSVTQLAVILLANQLPRILVSPIAGTFVDRWDRRWAMILSDAGAGAGTLVMVTLYVTGNLTIPALAAVAAVSGTFQAFQYPAYQAATTLLVPKERYSRASGMVQLAEAIGNLLAPVLGGIMIAVGGLGLLVAIDVVTFLFALGTLIAVRFPKPPVSEAGAASKGSIWRETAFGFRYIYERRGLFGLLLYFASINLVFGAMMPIITAFLLSITTPATMGTLFSIGATGMVLGAILASTWRGVQHKVRGILVLGAVLGVAVGTVGTSTRLGLIVVSFWVAMFMLPLVGAFSQAIWMAKVEPDVQGRVFAVRMAVSQAAVPLSLLAVGPLVDRVFVPLMTGSSTPGLWLQGVFGSGVTHAYGLFFVVVGILVVSVSGCAWLVGPIRHLERDIPDAVGLPSEIETEDDDTVPDASPA
ncbi:MAG: MFS transporter [Actinomycetota bacterium]|nr:MFS transporter [Actinomycetota bacterium]MDK1039337.1 MFS transporter [Actinomycetota bacterium]